MKEISVFILMLSLIIGCNEYSTEISQEIGSVKEEPSDFFTQENESSEKHYIFHAGTKLVNNKVLAIGGRVLNFVNLSDNFSSGRKEIINEIKKINWEGGFYRSDIGYKVINE